MKLTRRLFAALVAAILAMACIVPALATEIDEEICEPSQDAPVMQVEEVAPAAKAENTEPEAEPEAPAAEEESIEPDVEPEEFASEGIEEVEEMEEPAEDTDEALNEEADGEYAIMPMMHVPSEECEHPDYAVTTEVEHDDAWPYTYKSLGASGHLAIYSTSEITRCNKCGIVLDEAPAEDDEIEEAHDFFGGDEEEGYFCECGETSPTQTPADHEHVFAPKTYYYDEENAVLEKVDDEYHSVTSAIGGWETYCTVKGCSYMVGASFAYMQPEKIMTERHRFEDGVCACGAVCVHPDAFVSEAPLSGRFDDGEEWWDQSWFGIITSDYVTVIGEPTAEAHTVTYKVKEGKYCSLCSQEFDVTNTEETVTEAHLWDTHLDERECAICGYVRQDEEPEETEEPEATDEPEETEEPEEPEATTKPEPTVPAPMPTASDAPRATKKPSSMPKASDVPAATAAPSLHGVSAADDLRMGTALVKAMQNILAEYGADVMVAVRGAEALLTAEECASYENLSPMEQMLAVLAAMGYDAEVQNAIVEQNIELSVEAQQLIEAIRARVAAADDIHVEIVLDVQRPDGGWREEHYGFTPSEGVWKLADLRDAEHSHSWADARCEICGAIS